VLLLSGVGLIALLAYAVLAVTVLPGWIVSISGAKADENHRLDAIANTRSALLGVLTPLVVAIGAVAAFLNYRETSAQNKRTYELSQQALAETQRQNRETLDVTRRGQLTDRFTKAIEQLGQTDEDKLDIRLGGIYALERIAKESAELHGPVMEILTAFLREHSREPVNEVTAAFESDQSIPAGADPRLLADFQAILTVLGRRSVGHDPDGFRLDLRGAVMPGAVFTGGQFRMALVTRARLQKATFRRAELEAASFFWAELERADFVDSQLQRATFNFSKLHGAVFTRAQLQGAYFQGAELEGAFFKHADLEGAIFGGRSKPRIHRFDALGLTWEQLREARNVDTAILPDYLMKAREG